MLHGFTAKDDEADFFQMLRSRQCIDKMAKYSRGGMKNRNLLLYEAIDERLDAMLPHRNRVNRSPVKQGAEDILNSSINAVRRDKGQPVIGAQMQIVTVVPDLGQDIAVSLHDAFWLSCGS